MFTVDRGLYCFHMRGTDDYTNIPTLLYPQGKPECWWYRAQVLHFHLLHCLCSGGIRRTDTFFERLANLAKLLFAWICVLVPWSGEFLLLKSILMTSEAINISYPVFSFSISLLWKKPTVNAYKIQWDTNKTNSMLPGLEYSCN